MTPDAVQFAGWMACLFFLVAGVNSILKLVDRAKGEPANETLKGHADVMAQRVATLEVESHKAMERRRAMHDKIDHAAKDLREEMKEDLEKIYGEINQLRGDVAGLKTDNGHQNRHLTNIEAKLDRQIERGK